MAEFEYEESHVLFAWPAFVDLLAATVLILLVLIAVVIVNSRDVNSREGTLTTWRESLIAQLDTARNADTMAFDIDSSRDPLNVRLVLKADATFPRNQFRFDSMRAGARTALDRISSVLAQESIAEYTKKIRVEGHTDTVPYSQASSAFSNWELSAARAGAVARYLTQNSLIDPCKVEAIGRGESHPVLVGDSSKALDPEKSRRIEVWIEPSIKPSNKDSASSESLCWNPRKNAGSIGGRE